MAASVTSRVAWPTRSLGTEPGELLVNLVELLLHRAGIEGASRRFERDVAAARDDVDRAGIGQDFRAAARGPGIAASVGVVIGKEVVGGCCEPSHHRLECRDFTLCREHAALSRDHAGLWAEWEVCRHDRARTRAR